MKFKKNFSANQSQMSSKPNRTQSKFKETVIDKFKEDLLEQKIEDKIERQIEEYKSRNKDQLDNQAIDNFKPIMTEFDRQQLRQ